MRETRGEKLSPFFQAAIACACILLSGCGVVTKWEIDRILDARNNAITTQNVEAYARLIAPDYRDRGADRKAVIARIKRLFRRFEALDMRTIHRSIDLVDENHALCTQSYRLKVRVQGQWHTLLEREELTLEHTAAGWRITAGL